MFPINNLSGIEVQENDIKDRHVVIFLLVKPSDKNADHILKQFNYWHHLAGRYCSIYPIGYSRDLYDFYKDIQKIPGVDNETWEYSDQCFIDFCDELSIRLKGWTYSGEVEIIILQNRLVNDDYGTLDFRNYTYLDINYGLDKGYIDSVDRFMQRLITSCKSEVIGYEALKQANRRRLKPRNVIENAIDLIPNLPKPLKTILKDRLFYKSAGCI